MDRSATTNIALYQRLFDKLKNKIRQGDLSGKLPSIAELTREYNVSHNTIKKVLDRLKEQHYIYGMQGKGVYVNDAVTQSPAFQKNIVFYLHVETYRNPFYLLALSRLRQELESGKSIVHLVNSSKQLSEAASITDALLTVDINTPEEFKEIERYISRNKTVAFNKFVDDYKCVGTDNFAGGYMVAEHLYSRGHRKIGILSIDLNYVGGFFDCRYKGVLQFADEHPDMKVINCEIELPEKIYSYPAAAKLLKQAPDITAVFTLTDVIALGFISYCQQKGIGIPNDISLISCDNRDFASILSPPLTSMQEDTDELARQTVIQICRAINGEDAPAQIKVKPFLVERKSVRSLY
jgi:DNA-binding LacI/PurR family transcriptional regulator